MISAVSQLLMNHLSLHTINKLFAKLETKEPKIMSFCGLLDKKDLAVKAF